jgi:hypothetical protein
MAAEALIFEGEGSFYVGSWSLLGEVLEWEVEGKIYRLESGDDLSAEVRRFMKKFGDHAFKDRVRLRACLTCKNFSMSNMARDMGRGQRGTCAFHQKSAEICHLCNDYERGEV